MNAYLGVLCLLVRENAHASSPHGTALGSPLLLEQAEMAVVLFLQKPLPMLGRLILSGPAGDEGLANLASQHLLFLTGKTLTITFGEESPPNLIFDMVVI